MPAIEATEDGPYLGDDRLEQIHVRLEVTRAEKRAAHAQVHRLRSGIGAMVALLGGLDALVFTGGVGEGSARIRELACAGLAHLGVAGPDVEVLAIHAREDLDIARQVRAAMSRAT